MSTVVISNPVVISAVSGESSSADSKPNGYVTHSHPAVHPGQMIIPNTYNTYEIILQKMPKFDAGCIKRVIFNDPVTVVIWGDGTKTIVRCIEGQEYEPYAGFCAAVTKKLFGSTTRAKKISGAYNEG